MDAAEFAAHHAAVSVRAVLGGDVPPSDESSAFVALADVASSLRAVRRDVAQLRRHAGRAARRRGDIVAWSRNLPRLHLDPSLGPSGDEVLHGLATHQPWPFRYRAVAVMTLPPTFEDYLRGRPKQAVRTNRRHARSLGLRITSPVDSVQARPILEHMLEQHRFYPTIDELMRRHVDTGRAMHWFALDAAGEPLAMASVVRDGDVAQLANLQVALDASDRSAARFLLSTEIVRALIGHSVHHLIADSMLFAEPGVVYLQRRLGFVPTNIVVPRRRRRSKPVGYPEGVMTRALLLLSRGEAR